MESRQLTRKTLIPERFPVLRAAVKMAALVLILTNSAAALVIVFAAIIAVLVALTGLAVVLLPPAAILAVCGWLYQELSEPPKTGSRQIVKSEESARESLIPEGFRPSKETN